MNKRIALLTVFIFSTALFAADVPYTLDLKTAVDTALTNNKEILSSRFEQQGAQADVKSSYGRFLPQVNVEGKMTQINAPLVFDLSDIRTAMISADAATLRTAGVTNPDILSAFTAGLNSSVPPFEAQLQKEQYYNLTATLTQPLFTGGKLILNTRAKRQAYEIKGEQLEIVNNKIASETCQAYMRIQLARQVVDIRKDVLAGMLDHQKNAEMLFKQGMIARAAKLKTDVAVSEARRELSKSRKDLELAFLALKNAEGVELLSPVLTTELFVPEKLGALSEYTEKCSSKNHQKALISKNKNLLKTKESSIKSNFMPTVAAFGRYELYQNDLTIFDPEWAVGIVANINIFNGASDLMDIASTRKQIEAAARLEEYIDDSAKIQTEKYYKDIESAREQHDSLLKSRELADENLRLYKESFKEGMASASDVIDAELTLEKVKIEESKSLFDLDCALADLLNTTGNVLELFDYIPGKETK
jgi:outer membrane protein TolC